MTLPEVAAWNYDQPKERWFSNHRPTIAAELPNCLAGFVDRALRMKRFVTGRKTTPRNLAASPSWLVRWLENHRSLACSLFRLATPGNVISASMGCARTFSFAE